MFYKKNLLNSLNIQPANILNIREWGEKAINAERKKSVVHFGCFYGTF